MLYIILKKYREREEVFGIIKSTDSETLFQYSDIRFFNEMAEKETRFT